MALRYPYRRRKPLHGAFGSVNLFQSSRLAPGSVLTSDDVATDLANIKTFGVRGNRRGSVFVDVALMGTENYFTIFEGTFPGGFGSMKTVSFEEAIRRARVRIRAPNITGSVGSYSAFFNAFHPGLSH